MHRVKGAVVICVEYKRSPSRANSLGCCPSSSDCLSTLLSDESAATAASPSLVSSVVHPVSRNSKYRIAVRLSTGSDSRGGTIS